VVCDRCNNYFARKVEGPLLNSPEIANLRARQRVENKRGVIPPLLGITPQILAEVELAVGDSSLRVRHARDETRFVAMLQQRKSFSAYFISSRWIEDERRTSRFLAKIALEIFASRMLVQPGGQDIVVDEPQLDAVRHFARYGDRPAKWPFHRREIYNEDALHEGKWQVMHEFNLLVTSQAEIYAVICIFGTEFAINVGGRDVDGYRDWLREHQNRSPLYIKEELVVTEG
jgi:hypothetical protein